MRQPTFLALLSAILFVAVAVPAAPSPVDQHIEKRTKHGRGTWFYVGLGACGHKNVDSDHIVALATLMYNSGVHCGKTVNITNTANGKTARGVVADMCPGCGFKDLDMSPGLFEKLGDLDTGVLPIAWDFDRTGS